MKLIIINSNLCCSLFLNRSAVTITVYNITIKLVSVNYYKITVVIYTMNFNIINSAQLSPYNQLNLYSLGPKVWYFYRISQILRHCFVRIHFLLVCTSISNICMKNKNAKRKYSARITQSKMKSIFKLNWSLSNF